MPLSIKRYPTIKSDIENWIIANQDKISDFNEGAVLSSKIEAFSRIMEEVYIKNRVGFDKSLPGVAFYAFSFAKEGAQKASGSVVFSRTGTSGQVDIPAGTLISTPAGLKFETTAGGSIPDGQSQSQPIAVQAYKKGKEYNVPANTITVIVTPIVGVEQVNNSSSTTGGQDEETNAEFLKRFNEFIEGLGKSNITGLKTGAKSVTGVRSASVIEHFPPVDTYNLTVYIDDGAGNASQELIDAVEEVLIGEGTEENPGYKGGGIKLRVLAPTKVTIDVTVDITDNGSLSQSVIKYNIEQVVTNYINKLEIGEDVILNKIRAVIMNEPAVTDISITAPTGNTSIGQNQIARVGTITVNFP